MKRRRLESGSKIRLFLSSYELTSIFNSRALLELRLNLVQNQILNNWPCRATFMLLLFKFNKNLHNNHKCHFKLNL